MPNIKVRRHENGPWVAVAVVDTAREGWVEVDDGGERLWLELAAVHPADQVVLAFEQQARQRYVWVPKEDLDQPG